MVPCGNTPHPETSSVQSFCEGHQNQRALTPNAPKQIMENYDEPCMIKWQHRGSVRYFVAGRPAGSLAHRIWWWKLMTCWLYKLEFQTLRWYFSFQLGFLATAGKRMNSFDISPNFPPWNRLDGEGWGSGPFGIDCEEGFQIFSVLAGTLHGLSFSRDIPLKTRNKKVMAYVKSNIWDGWP